MCFGSSKDKDIFDAEGPRPSYNQPQQPSYSSPPKASVPPAAAPSYQMPQQQRQNQHPQASELSAPPPVELSADNDFAPPPGPPPSHARPSSNRGDVSSVGPPPGPPPSFQSNNPFRSNNDEFAPPPGPPPSHRQQDNDFAPPPGPPPAHRSGADDFAPPPGPPPSHRDGADDFAPPPGPPPSKRQDDYTQPPPGPPPSHGEKSSKPEHDWQSVVPDTSLFPPPPSFFSGFERSPATNATEAEAEHGEQWCRDHPLSAPIQLDHYAIEALNTHNIRLMEPTTGFRGSLKWQAPGVWSAKTDSKSLDNCIIGYPPMYSVTQHSPLASPSGRKTIYYEVLIKNDHKHGDVCLALGYTALPYPSFRMPGWHRGSLAVHGDDGHKFINDRWGGKTFTDPFRRGETYGIGMTFTANNGRIEVDIFFTRQGRETGRWNLHEEGDSEEDLPVTGLEGFHDLSCAIGTYTGVEFDIIFDPNRWLHRPAGY
ncbi:hypothetical protein QBC37DRAFT_407705 [Rhypophila decipiens]|uniref:SPRY domain-containing protein n=1 Tax=Rhypophila decipiens TaxID=261697 RepID=A0AAN7BBT4_9PEZI|nr:hypothetical protein QBC37DRAFT_407705 [Rhypophila decipiens]